MKDLIEKRLEELIPSSSETIYKAARYSLLGGGKRIRPLIVLTVASSYGAALDLALDPACAVEMIHTYSLIHDDLPCMDDDDLRRGKPTLHKQFNEAIALLTGDYLLTYAFEVIGESPRLSADQKLQLVQTLAKRAGAKGMIGGQVIDIESQGKTIHSSTLIAMHEGKTASLLSACFEFGAIIANVSSSPLQKLGADLGLIYQFQDDFLNATSTTEELGKRAASDAAKEKSTAVSLFGLDQTQILIRDLEASILKTLSSLPQPLTPLVQNILNRRL